MYSVHIECICGTIAVHFQICTTYVVHMLTWLSVMSSMCPYAARSSTDFSLSVAETTNLTNPEHDAAQSGGMERLRS